MIDQLERPYNATPPASVSEGRKTRRTRRTDEEDKVNWWKSSTNLADAASGKLRTPLFLYDWCLFYKKWRMSIRKQTFDATTVCDFTVLEVPCLMEAKKKSELGSWPLVGMQHQSRRLMRERLFGKLSRSTFLCWRQTIVHCWPVGKYGWYVGSQVGRW